VALAFSRFSPRFGFLERSTSFCDLTWWILISFARPGRVPTLLSLLVGLESRVVHSSSPLLLRYAFVILPQYIPMPPSYGIHKHKKCKLYQNKTLALTLHAGHRINKVSMYPLPCATKQRSINCQ